MIYFHLRATPAELSASRCPSYRGERRKKQGVVLNWRLSNNLAIIASNSSHIRYTMLLASQLQATVKFYGVFASHLSSLDFTPECSVQRYPVGDSEDLIAPFMHVTNQMTRHYATLRELELLPPFNGPYTHWNELSDTVTGQTSPAVQGFTA